MTRSRTLNLDETWLTSEPLITFSHWKFQDFWIIDFASDNAIQAPRWEHTGYKKQLVGTLVTVSGINSLEGEQTFAHGFHRLCHGRDLFCLSFLLFFPFVPTWDLDPASLLKNGLSPGYSLQHLLELIPPRCLPLAFSCLVSELQCPSWTQDYQAYCSRVWFSICKWDWGWCDIFFSCQ